MSENFQNLILSKYISSEEGRQDQKVNSSDLQDMRAGRDINELVFRDADAFLESLTALIKEQLRGETGRLLNDSSANYFFLQGKDGESYSILVRWEPAQKLWRCGAYLQKELKIPSIRIFYPE